MNADMQLIIKQKCIASQYICNNVSSGFANFCKYFATFACLAFGDFYCIHCKQLHMYYAYSRVGKYYLFLKCKMKMLLALTLWYFGVKITFDFCNLIVSLYSVLVWLRISLLLLPFSN